MLHEKFFSYEFFSEGVFGLKTFLFVVLILMVVLAFYMWGFILTAKLGRIQHSKTGQYGSYRWFTYGLFGTSVLLHFVLYDIGWRTDNLSRLPVVSVFGFVLMFAMSSFVGANIISKLSNWIPSAVFILASATIPVLDQEMTADLVGLGLANFNVGGGVTARVVRLDEKGTVVYEGKLLLLTPRNAYFREGKRGYRVIQQSDSVSVSVGKG